MATFKHTLLALSGAVGLAIGMATVAYADGPGDEGDSEWMATLRASGSGSGSNLAVPTPVSASPMTKCGDVAAAPQNYASNIVRYCSTHRS